MKHLLIVEDDLSIRETLKDILELSGYQVSTAKNGEEGLKLILEEKPELVLCDVCMPVLDGFQLIEEVKSRFAYGNAPLFVFLTAKVELSEVRKGMRLGAAAYIKKPFDHMSLLYTINKLKKRTTRRLKGKYCDTKSNLKRPGAVSLA